MAQPAVSSVNVDVSKISQGGAFRGGIITSAGPVQQLLDHWDNMSKVRAQNDALEMVNKKHLEFTAQTSDLQRNPALSPEEKSKALIEAARQYIEHDDKDVLAMKPEARSIYKTHIGGLVASKTEQLVSQQVQADITLQASRFSDSQETLARDAASFNEGDPRLPLAIKQISDNWDNAPQGIGLDPVKGKRASLDMVAIARTETRAQTHPLETIKAYGEGKQIGVELPTGDDTKPHTYLLSPQANQHIMQIAHGELARRAAASEASRVQSLHTNTLMQQQTFDETATRIASGDVGAYDDLVGASNYALQEGNKPIISASQLNSLREMTDQKKLSIEQGGPTKTSEYARIADGIENGKIQDSSQIWGQPFINGDGQKELYKRFIQKQESRRDQSYVRFEKDQKEAESYLKAWVNGKNPLSALGGVNSSGAQAVARYRTRMRDLEGKARTDNKGYDGIDPMNHVALFIQDMTKDMANNFEQDADKMLRSLSQFVPLHEPPTHTNIMHGIMASDLPNTEKNIMIGLLQQSMRQNGVLLKTLSENRKADATNSRSSALDYEVIRQLAAGLVPKEK